VTRVLLENLRRLALPALSALLTACAGAAQSTISLRVQGNVDDASVTIDDQYIGPFSYVAARGVALPPGKHRITVEKVGYFPWDQMVEATEAPIHLSVVLTKIPD